ncbi:acyl-CoA dehydrogenase family protein [uncultured Sneathiella sp.]|jgi:alkylation response protein AidB-like acyl-CoA dehydrogenase|uniref:acyl-CoA dehydrogenase family protein n=1 Tax=uncultured Sneathiella sp. TaxID=879315 RepID=UPI0030DA46AF|tara:strand:- start:28223 stop:30010 length:1788 start_codon:yes stop_codon:yes gene_type:complete
MTFLHNKQEFKPQELSDYIAPDCHGLNFYEIDTGLQDLLHCYMPDDLRQHLEPHYRKLGELSGNQLDDWSRDADRHKPVLHARDARGRNEDWIEFHPSYRKMEDVAFKDFGFHRMSHREGVFGWSGKVPPLGKYVFQYLFGQSEFGQLCPISATETSAMLIERYADDSTKEKLLERMFSQDMDKILKGAQFMTEKTGGSDVSNIELQARFEEGNWRLYGEKWFCSCADGDVALLLARPEGAPEGNSGLALFAMPRTLDDGSRNPYRIVRLKDKLGTKSMASGEIIFEGAVAYPLGKVGAHPNQGLKLMMDQVNFSRLSHGVRGAAMMRRCLNEALTVANYRKAFGETIIDKPLLRRQLMKLMVPTEQALSMFMYVAVNLAKGEAGDEAAAKRTRILTPLLKFRTARDNIRVATGAMEVRGGNGYIEDWVNPRLVRDAHLGVLWEGTSNINSLDVTTRAIARSGAHEDLAEDLARQIEANDALPGQYAGQLKGLVDQTVKFAEDVARQGKETHARKAASALYHVTTATLMANEGAELGAAGRDARRLLLSRMIVDHKLVAPNPLSIDGSAFDDTATDALLSDAPVSLEEASRILTL